MTPDEADARAACATRPVFDAVMGAGYIPYRVGNQSMAALDPARRRVLEDGGRIKAALDPDGLIAPGRYQPAREGADAAANCRRFGRSIGRKIGRIRPAHSATVWLTPSPCGPAAPASRRENRPCAA